MNGAGRKPSTLLMNRMRPERCARMCGRTARVTRTEPKKFTSNNACAWAISVSSMAPPSRTAVLPSRMHKDLRSRLWTFHALSSSKLQRSSRNELRRGSAGAYVFVKADTPIANQNVIELCAAIERFGGQLSESQQRKLRRVH